MPWIQLTLKTCRERAEALGDRLIASGAVSITFQDACDNPVFEPLPGETPLWNATYVIGLYEVTTDMKEVIMQLQSSAQPDSDFSYNLEQVDDQNWERACMDSFHPLCFGTRLWICPSWCAVPDPDAVNIMLDPGLAFGTGSHPTTALCLSWLDSLNLAGKTLIDFGCGSGILAISALKLGAVQAMGIDIDPQALEASRDNAGRNGVSERLTLYDAKNYPVVPADVLVMNILAGPLCDLALVVTTLVKPGGYICLSGLLASQATRVAQAYEAAFTLMPVVEKEGWCCITGRKK